MIIFAILTLQATCYFSLLRYSRTRPHKMYFTSTAVFLAEVIKLLVTLVVIVFQHRNLKQLGSFLVDSFLLNPMVTLKLSLASVLYVIQNNLVYIAMTHLESTTFQVRVVILQCLSGVIKWKKSEGFHLGNSQTYWETSIKHNLLIVSLRVSRIEVWYIGLQQCDKIPD